MKNVNYFVGLDIGTDSVGYAVTDEQYELCKHKCEPMWGVTLFDEAQTATERRSFRTARRRLDRRQQRLHLLMELFAQAICDKDEGFFKRIQESYKYPEDESQKVRLFGTYEEQKKYMNKYPTIHHLICDLMNDAQPHDVRLVYITCAWLVAHRGHFLSEVSKDNIASVTEFKTVYDDLVGYIKRDGMPLPWSEDIDKTTISEAISEKLGVTKKSEKLSKILFDGKAPKKLDETHEYNYDCAIKVLCGGKVELNKLFAKDEYSQLEEKSIVLNMDDEKLVAIMRSIDEEDAEFIRKLKAVYDWSILVGVLKGKNSISEAKVEVYEQHQADLKLLKRMVKKYLSKEKYNEVFRSEPIAKKNENNYVAYIGKNQTANTDIKLKKATDKEDFCKYILKIFEEATPSDNDEEYKAMISSLENNSFMPKQVNGDNRVIPYQLYWHELNTILENAKSYIPFLNEKDADGFTGMEKILSIFEFRVPYYVGPLKENPDNNRNLNHWMVRKAKGKIYPWNFEDKVDLDISENQFISRLTNSCTYLPGEEVLPKCSLIYSAFEVLNEINNIKINDIDIPVEVKQSIYNDVFMNNNKVTPKKIHDYLIANGYAKVDDIISGIDITIKSSLKSFRAFSKLIAGKLLSNKDVEDIITRATYSEDKARYKKWLQANYAHLPENEINYISGLTFKEFGRLSKKLLCEIESVYKETGECMNIIRAMWETNLNFMQIMHSGKFEFESKVQGYVEDYYKDNPKSLSERLDEMYVSNAVKRPIIRTLDILKDIVKVQGQAPKTIFVEMARGSNEDQKGKRTKSRLDQINELYTKVKTEDVKILKRQLEELGDSAHNKLQSNKLFLYFIQLGKCLYTGEIIPIESVISGDGNYDIEHIYPRSFVKDDSIVNNLILVNTTANGAKSDSYPISPEIQNEMRGLWAYLHENNLISDEKFKRLTRSTPFTDEERFEFINRQLVETRQSSKVIATLLKELYPKTEIVYVKAGLVSDFRQEFELVKSRAVNDLHHAKDAYLNIVCGNVWHYKYSRQFWREDANDNNAKAEVVFTHPVSCNDKVIWNGAKDKDRIVKIVRKNTAHMTMYPYYKHSGQNGGFFDQNPLSAASKKDLIPLKKDRPTELYGGYNGATIFGFVLAKYTSGKKAEVSLVPIKAMCVKQFIDNREYAKEYVAGELGEKATNIEILFNNRIIKIFTMISLDGARYCIRGKAGASTVGLMNMMPFFTSTENEKYVKKLESFVEKKKKNEKFVWDEKFDGVSKEKNVLLFKHYIVKLSEWPYSTRPGNDTLLDNLRNHSKDFEKLDVFGQSYTLLQIQGTMGRIKQADLKQFGGSPSSGITSLSLNISNWKNNYKDVRIVDQSASGLFEKSSDNLLDLL